MLQLPGGRVCIMSAITRKISHGKLKVVGRRIPVIEKRHNSTSHDGIRSSHESHRRRKAPGVSWWRLPIVYETKESATHILGRESENLC